METYDKLSVNGFSPADHGVRNQFVCSERRSKYVLSLEPSMEGWRYQVDNYIITAGDKCDALILAKEGGDYAEVFVELKGSDVSHAITQLEETLKHDLFKNNDFLLRWARIAVYSYPKSQLLDQVVDKKTGEFLKKYRCELLITHADKLTHDMFEAFRKAKTREPHAINISGLLNSRDDTKICQAVAMLYLRLNTSQAPLEVVNPDWILQLLSILNDSDGEVVPSALKYIELSIKKCKDVFIDDNLVLLLNALLEKYKGKFEGIELVLPEEIEDRAEDVRQALLTIVTFLNEIDHLDGDVEFWSALAEQ